MPRRLTPSSSTVSTSPTCLWEQVVQVAPENGISFALNELLRDRVCQRPEQPTVAEKFAVGAVAGAVAMTAVCESALPCHQIRLLRSHTPFHERVNILC